MLFSRGGHKFVAIARHQSWSDAHGLQWRRSADARGLFKLSTVSYLEARRNSRQHFFIERFEARPLRAFIGLGYAIARRSRGILEAVLRSRLEVAFAILLVFGRQGCIPIPDCVKTPVSSENGRAQNEFSRLAGF